MSGTGARGKRRRWPYMEILPIKYNDTFSHKLSNLFELYASKFEVQTTEKKFICLMKFLLKIRGFLTCNLQITYKKTDIFVSFPPTIN